MDKKIYSRFYVCKFDSHGLLERDNLNFSDCGYYSIVEAEQAILDADLWGEYFILQSYYIRTV
jgi:hypothetical protein